VEWRLGGCGGGGAEDGTVRRGAPEGRLPAGKPSRGVSSQQPAGAVPLHGRLAPRRVPRSPQSQGRNGMDPPYPESRGPLRRGGGRGNGRARRCHPCSGHPRGHRVRRRHPASAHRQEGSARPGSRRGRDLRHLRHHRRPQGGPHNSREPVRQHTGGPCHRGGVREGQGPHERPPQLPRLRLHRLRSAPPALGPSRGAASRFPAPEEPLRGAPGFRDGGPHRRAHHAALHPWCGLQGGNPSPGAPIHPHRRRQA